MFTSHSGNTNFKLETTYIIQVYCGLALAMLLTKEIGLLSLLHVKVYFKYFLN